jgi:hypothetical protein
LSRAAVRFARSSRAVPRERAAIVHDGTNGALSLRPVRGGYRTHRATRRSRVASVRSVRIGLPVGLVDSSLRSIQPRGRGSCRRAIDGGDDDGEPAAACASARTPPRTVSPAGSLLLTFIVSIASTSRIPAAALLPSLVSREAFRARSPRRRIARWPRHRTGSAGDRRSQRRSRLLDDEVLMAVACLAADFARRAAPRRSTGERSAKASLLRHHPVVLGCMTLDMLAVILAAPRRCCRSITTTCTSAPAARSSRVVPDIGALPFGRAHVLRPITGQGRRCADVAVYGLATIAFGVSRWSIFARRLHGGRHRGSGERRCAASPSS